MKNNAYNRLKVFNFCSNGNNSDYMKRYNMAQHYLRIDKIKNRKNNFLPKINSRRNIMSPRSRLDVQKIEEDNLKIFKSLFSIDNRLPVLSEKKYLNKKYIKDLKKERSELIKIQLDIVNNYNKENKKRFLLSPLNSVRKAKYELYNSKNVNKSEL